MKSFKNFISEGDVILFPGKQPKPEQKPIPQYSEPEIPLDQIKAHAKSVGEEVFSTLKANGRKFETPTLTSAYGTDRRAHPDFFTQLNDHIFGEGGNREFAIQYYKNNKEAIYASIKHSIKNINEIEGRHLPATTGRTHEAMVKRETGLPIFQLETLEKKLRGLDE